MKMHAISFDHPEQRIELVSSRDRFRIQNQGLRVSMRESSNTAGWTLKQVQGDVV
jgi:hypothetical protein